MLNLHTKFNGTVSSDMIKITHGCSVAVCHVPLCDHLCGVVEGAREQKSKSKSKRKHVRAQVTAREREGGKEAEEQVEGGVGGVESVCVSERVYRRNLKRHQNT